MELGEIIRTARRSAGFTQEQLAQKLGISTQEFVEWENAEKLHNIAREFIENGY